MADEAFTVYAICAKLFPGPSPRVADREMYHLLWLSKFVPGFLPRAPGRHGFQPAMQLGLRFAGQEALIVRATVRESPTSCL
jgi:hypothetical protein